MDFAVPHRQVIQLGLFDLENNVFTETMRIGLKVQIGSTGLNAKPGIADTTITDRPILALHRHSEATNNFVEGFASPGDELMRKFHINGNGSFVAGSDFAEALSAAGDKTSFEPGDVLILSATAAGSVEKCNRDYDTKIIGVYSARPAVLGADKNGETRVDDDEIPVAIAGIVPTKVSAHNGAIAPGDLLTTSEIPGHAMKATPTMVDGVAIYPAGTILGKAIEPLQDSAGIIKVLLMMR
jgi:hypothetical protein